MHASTHGSIASTEAHVPLGATSAFKQSFIALLSNVARLLSSASVSFAVERSQRLVTSS
jgi:hypothetical protein